MGVVEVPGDEDLVFTVADVPGLLEGASEGVGLGHEFLAHLERCHLLLHVVDATGYYGADPEDNFRTILSELDAHTPALGRTPQVVVLNKVDAIDLATREQRVRVLPRSGPGAACLRVIPPTRWTVAEETPQPASRWCGKCRPPRGKGWPRSCATWASWSPPVASRRNRRVGRLRRTRCRRFSGPAARDDPGGAHMVYRPAGLAQEDFSVRREDDHFVVEGEAVERMVKRYDLENDQAVRYLGRRLDRMGVHGALRQAGASAGDEVHIAGFVFEFD